jgi:hypothetical protein
MSLRGPREVDRRATSLPVVLQVGHAMRSRSVLVPRPGGEDVGGKRKERDMVEENVPVMLEFYIQQTGHFYRLLLSQRDVYGERFKTEFDGEAAQYTEATEELDMLQMRLNNMSIADRTFAYAQITAGREGDWIMKQLPEHVATFVADILKNVDSNDWP